MTSRERVKNTINFKKADRVPIDIGSNIVTGIHPNAHIELANYLGYKIEPPKTPEWFYMVSRLDEKIRSRLHCDVIELENPSTRWGIENRNWKKWVNQQGNIIFIPGELNPIREKDGSFVLRNIYGETIARMPRGGYYFDLIESINLTKGKFKKIDPDDWKKSIEIYSDEHLEELAKTAKWIYENTDYSICGGFRKGGFPMSSGIAGHSFLDWLCILVTDSDYAYSIIQATAERAVENLKLYIQAVGKYIDTIFVSATDFGTQTSEMFDPDIWKKLYLPNYKMINDYIHDNSNIKTFYHCCGSIFNLIEYFIESGVDIINPLQTSAANMNPYDLKEKFGGRIVFWGAGVETQSTLQFGTPDEVRDQVIERIKIFAPGGGYVFNQIHVIQGNVPPENILAMVDTAYDFGKYPVS